MDLTWRGCNLNILGHINSFRVIGEKKSGAIFIWCTSSNKKVTYCSRLWSISLVWFNSPFFCVHGAFISLVEPFDVRSRYCSLPAHLHMHLYSHIPGILFLSHALLCYHFDVFSVGLCVRLVGVLLSCVLCGTVSDLWRWSCDGVIVNFHQSGCWL